MSLSTEAVLALAPDDASAKAAKGLVAPAKWPTLAFSDEAVWGECQGSGSKPYQTQVDLSGPVFRCSCPSRKFPCKHGLALMLMRAQNEASFSKGDPPPWVAEWLASRREKAEKKEARAAEPPAAPDPAAAAKRDAQRWKRIEAGVQELARWLDDQTRRGLASLGSEQQQAWGAMAARMVDAQAPGLGQRIVQAAELIGVGEGWPARLLDRLGRLQLIADAVPRRESLSPATLADLRTALGWPQDRDALLAEGERVGDHWLVLGQCTDERDGRLVERHVWLQGRASGRRALLLDYAHGGRGFETGWISGSERPAVLCFYPGHASQRALVAELPADASSAAAVPASAAPAMDTPGEWQRAARQIAANPWQPLLPMVWDGAVSSRDGDRWWLRLEAAPQALPMQLAAQEAWQLMAHSGGAPLRVFGEWDGEHFVPLTAWSTDAASGAAPVWTLAGARA